MGKNHASQYANFGSLRQANDAYAYAKHMDYGFLVP